MCWTCLLGGQLVLGRRSLLRALVHEARCFAIVEAVLVHSASYSGLYLGDDFGLTLRLGYLDGLPR